MKRSMFRWETREQADDMTLLDLNNVDTTYMSEKEKRFREQVLSWKGAPPDLKFTAPSECEILFGVLGSRYPSARQSNGKANST